MLDCGTDDGEGNLVASEEGEIGSRKRIWIVSFISYCRKILVRHIVGALVYGQVFVLPVFPAPRGRPSHNSLSI